MVFDLVTQPWLPVIAAAGSSRRVVLGELLATGAGQDLRAFAGEPPVAVTLLRLGVAILHDALGGPRTDDEWSRWWRDGSWPTAPVADYLAAHQARFDLFGDDPFGQDIRLADRPRKSIAEMLPHRASGENAVWWSHNTSARGDAPLCLAAAEAACWLLAEHQFSRCGVFASVAGRKVIAVQPPLTNRAITYPVADTLAETLLLNPSVYQPHPDDRPPWRCDSPVIAGPPTGRVSLLTWQTRNLLLFADGHAAAAGGCGDTGTDVTVTECVRAAEDSIDCTVDVATLETLDPHPAFRTTADGRRVPVVLRPGRGGVADGPGCAVRHLYSRVRDRRGPPPRRRGNEPNKAVLGQKQRPSPRWRGDEPEEHQARMRQLMSAPRARG